MITRGISKPTTTTILPVKTPDNQLNSKDAQFDSALQRWQNGVVTTLDAVLTYLNSHFAPATPTVTNKGRTVAPDLTTLVSADTGNAIVSTYPFNVQIASASITASMSNAIVSTIAVPKGWSVDSIYVSAPTPTGGQGTISAQPNTVKGWQGVPIGGNTGLVLTSAVLSVPVSATSAISTVSLYANTSSAWAIPSGTVNVTLYLAQSVT